MPARYGLDPPSSRSPWGALTAARSVRCWSASEREIGSSCAPRRARPSTPWRRRQLGDLPNLRRLQGIALARPGRRVRGSWSSGRCRTSCISSATRGSRVRGRRSAWEIDTIVAGGARRYGAQGALVTHTHQDHVGGSLESWGMPGRIPGVEELLGARAPQGVRAQGRARVPEGLGSDLVKVDGHDTLAVGRLTLTFLHTPGHTPGSQCFLDRRHWCRATHCSSGPAGARIFRGAIPARCTTR